MATDPSDSEDPYWDDWDEADSWRGMGGRGYSGARAPLLLLLPPGALVCPPALLCRPTARSRPAA